MKTIDIEYLTAEDLELEVLCSYCNGSGNIHRQSLVTEGAIVPVPCPNCRGRRWIITELGDRILDLVRRYETRVQAAIKVPNRTGETKDPMSPEMESGKS